MHIWKAQISDVKDHSRRNILHYFVKLFEDNVLRGVKETEGMNIYELFKELPENGNFLRKSLIHMDPNDGNILISNPESPHADGIIDFDDIQIAYLIDDLTVALSHCFHGVPKTNPQTNRLAPSFKKYVHGLVQGYNRVLKLNEEEARCLYYFLGVRIGMCLVLESRDILMDPSNNHIGYDHELLWGYLEELSRVDPREFESVVREGCGFEVK
jgi:Ser/Thr protein kinase RdoA (MazF antagonist)